MALGACADNKAVRGRETRSQCIGGGGVNAGDGNPRKINQRRLIFLNSKSLFSFFMPGGFLFFAAVILIRMNVFADWLPGIVSVYPFAVLAAGILLGWRFNRSRLVFGLLILAIADRSMLYFTKGASISAGSGILAFYAVAILLPLNFAVLSIIKERGIINVTGIRRLCLILAQPVAVVAACRYGSFGVNAILDYPIIKSSLLKYLPALPLPQPALMAGILALLLLWFRYARSRGAIEGGLFWALLTAFFAVTEHGATSTFYFSSAGLILVVSVIEASYAMAFRDELTGLPTRRTLNEFLFKLGDKYSLAMLDIDFFKKFNDTYGHDVGDQVLRMVASKISAVAGGGRAFRYGGEEFTVIFPGKSRSEAIPHLEQLRTAIQAAGFVVRCSKRPRKKPARPNPRGSSQKRVAVTISIGVAERNGQHSSAQDVIKASDKALYRAKRAGRNRVTV
jgi:diguanylate cyclase (GGDEF)-like protein